MTISPYSNNHVAFCARTTKENNNPTTPKTNLPCGCTPSQKAITEEETQRACDRYYRGKLNKTIEQEVSAAQNGFWTKLKDAISPTGGCPAFPPPPLYDETKCEDIPEIDDIDISDIDETNNSNFDSETTDSYKLEKR